MILFEMKMLRRFWFLGSGLFVAEVGDDLEGCILIRAANVNVGGD